MTKPLPSVLAAILVLTGGVLVANRGEAQDIPQLALSPELAKIYNQAKEDMQALRWREALVDAQSALSYNKRKPGDTFHAYDLVYQVSHATGDRVSERSALRHMIDLNLLSADQQAVLVGKLKEIDSRNAGATRKVEFVNALLLSTVVLDQEVLRDFKKGIESAYASAAASYDHPEELPTWDSYTVWYYIRPAGGVDAITVTGTCEQISADLNLLEPGWAPVIKDGGSCVFHAMYDVASKRVTSFEFGGRA